MVLDYQTAVKHFQEDIDSVQRMCANNKITPILVFPDQTWKVLDFSDLLIISATEAVLGSEIIYLVKILREDFCIYTFGLPYLAIKASFTKYG